MSAANLRNPSWGREMKITRKNSRCRYSSTPAFMAVEKFLLSDNLPLVATVLALIVALAMLAAAGD
jgi:hypothetical protein